MGKELIRSLKESFKKIYLNTDNFISYKNYYIALTNWINYNIKVIDKDLLKKNGLDVLMNLDPDEYIIDHPDFWLDKEPDRMKIHHGETLDILLAGIADTMWDMVALQCDDSCPSCTGDCGLRYLKVNYNDPDKEQIVMECNICGQLFYPDGKKYENKVENYLPAKKSEIDSLIDLLP